VAVLVLVTAVFVKEVPLRGAGPAAAKAEGQDGASGVTAREGLAETV
jgi:hypothetical protein